jgi:hypothetical protein
MMLRGFSGTLGCTGLYFLPKNTTMNGTHYQEVMEDHLLMFMGIHGCTHFLQDGVPFHASKRIKDFLAEQPTKVIGWPGNSSDLNPIENCWNHMKILRKNKAAIRQLWTEELKPEFLRSSSNSMPKRLEIVIATKIGMTKYSTVLIDAVFCQIKRKNCRPRVFL